MNATYVSRILGLTLLASDIVEAILDRGSRPSYNLMIFWSGFRWLGNGREGAPACSEVAVERTIGACPLALPICIAPSHPIPSRTIVIAYRAHTYNLWVRRNEHQCHMLPSDESPKRLIVCNDFTLSTASRSFL